MSENLYIVYLDETGESSVKAEPAHAEVEADEIVVLPGPIFNSEDWLSFERNSCSAAAADARFGDNIHDPMQWSGS